MSEHYLRRVPDRTISGFQESPEKVERAVRRRPRANSKAQAVAYKVSDTARRYTWLPPLIVMLAFLAAYGMNPGPDNWAYPFIFLSYPVPGTHPQMYGKGPKDILFCIYYGFFFTFLREFIMQMAIRPMAIRMGIKGKSKQMRFMEQMYAFLYFGFFGPFGLYNMYKTPLWYFNTEQFWVDFPHRTHNATFKLNYLLEASYWIQQAVVLALMLEKPRKDFKELVFHHLVTLALIFLSYRFHFTWIGLCVYVTMDVSDIFLALSKILNYLDHWLGVPMYMFFVGVWIYLRHYLNLKFLWSIVYEMPYKGPFELNWETQQYSCWISQYITFTLLVLLFAVNSFWLFLIIRIGLRYLVAGVKKDERSDDDDDDAEEETATEAKHKDD